jgi:lysophospholipase L1-like esterase
MKLIRTLVLIALAALSLAAQDFYLKSGDTVVLYGDSITDQRLYTTFTETYAVTRFPTLDVRFVHSGWGGDRVSGGGGGPIDVRLKRDVFVYKPTVMTIMLGMNDGRYKAFDQDLFDTYANGIKNIVKAVKAERPGIRITLIQPSPYDDATRPPTFPGGYNAVLLRYSQFLKEFAQSDHLDLADLNTEVFADLARANGVDPEGAKKLLPDRVHPGPGGHLLMAEALLKAWNAPSVVTSVEIDATERKAIRTDNTTVTELSADGSLTWTQTDKALPMPINMKDPSVRLAISVSDVEKALDQQPLKVTGLSASRYTLKIDGETVGTFTKQQLADGMNLAMLDTPMTRQAGLVHELTLKHNNIHNVRWRVVQVPLQDETYAHKDAVFESLDALENEIIQQQHAKAQPSPHRYELLAEAN